MEIESYLGFGAFNMKAKWRTAVKAVAFFLLIVLGSLSLQLQQL
jgi:hypothetical protein